MKWRTSIGFWLLAMLCMEMAMEMAEATSPPPGSEDEEGEEVASTKTTNSKKTKKKKPAEEEEAEEGEEDVTVKPSKMKKKKGKKPMEDEDETEENKTVSKKTKKSKAKKDEDGDEEDEDMASEAEEEDKNDGGDKDYFKKSKPWYNHLGKKDCTTDQESLECREDCNKNSDCRSFHEQSICNTQCFGVCKIVSEIQKNNKCLVNVMTKIKTDRDLIKRGIAIPKKGEKPPKDDKTKDTKDKPFLPEPKADKGTKGLTDLGRQRNPTDGEKSGVVTGLLGALK